MLKYLYFLYQYSKIIIINYNKQKIKRNYFNHYIDNLYKIYIYNLYIVSL